MKNSNSRIINQNSRATSYRIIFKGDICFKKVFNLNNPDARECFCKELFAYELFKGRPWINPILEKGEDYFITPYFDPSTFRLDKAVIGLSDSERKEIAKSIIDIIFEIYQKGYVHRDIHSENIFLIEKRLIIVDFEMLTMFSCSKAVPFTSSYDLTGKGLYSPFYTRNMCYSSMNEKSLLNVLKIPLEEVTHVMTRNLKNELILASRSFETNNNRHICHGEKIYTSYSLGDFQVLPEEAQRNSDKRLKKLRINISDLKNKSLLDLGCNTGGMLFAAQQFCPLYSYGYEIDEDKVEIANKIARYNGLFSIKFVQADIDELNLKMKFDIVFCFAIESHVKDKDHLYNLLNSVTSDTLYFEGNATTIKEDVIYQLLSHGFKYVRYLGLCNDDIKKQNNNRPLFIAKKNYSGIKKFTLLLRRWAKNF